MYRLSNKSALHPPEKLPLIIYHAELHDFSLILNFTGGHCLVGQVFNDSKERFSDGTYVKTDTVTRIANGYAETNEDVYKLVAR
jgi:hypothetical protein